MVKCGFVFIKIKHFICLETDPHSFSKLNRIRIWTRIYFKSCIRIRIKSMRIRNTKCDEHNQLNKELLEFMTGTRLPEPVPVSFNLCEKLNAFISFVIVLKWHLLSLLSVYISSYNWIKQYHIIGRSEMNWLSVVVSVSKIILVEPSQMNNGIYLR
jgi:hypothetical protein